MTTLTSLRDAALSSVTPSVELHRTAEGYVVRVVDRHGRYVANFGQHQLQAAKMHARRLAGSLGVQATYPS